MSLESESNKTRLDQLNSHVAQCKKELRYWENLVTHEICLLNGQHYGLKNRSTEKEE